MSDLRAPVDVTVMTSGHDVADARLHREVAALLARGLRVEVFGLGHAADAPPGAIVRTWPRQGALGRARLAARMAARANGRIVMTLDPDSALAANAAVLTSGRSLVVDVHEDFAALLADRPWARSLAGLAGVGAQGLVKAFLLVASRAALTVVADEHVPPLKARRRFVLPNEPVAAMLPDPTPPGPTPRALYIGDVRATRGLFAMLEALRLAPDWHLDVVGPVAPADTDRLREVLTADPSLAERVHMYDRRPPTQAWQQARGAWCGLLLLADTPAFAEALPSKLGEYLACGLPVITTDLRRQAEVVRACGAGEVVPAGDDEQVGAAVAEVLRSWSAEGRESRDAKAQAAVQYAAHQQRGSSVYEDFADTVAALL
ncbi:glycosyltransferase involved in cell wall biosynthesis [Kineosphaera limosa]|uniref:Putative glycosyltransferase n=1 Tax=Kineosphaera limosa NBRC 100340 TaxID=1184609 RepID=K6WFX0_9MICO|nr:glycosyltransferase [Kineosphaera limosa]NYE01961.1 glycosyltransferase involved in cell wall biosynthesis [Kineosphaera limosa]GAB98185.1 putative glycosyltransferase [Kineosphaera limosa NBRC 100340]